MTLFQMDDRQARRLEFGAFAGLALSGMTLIAMTAWDSVRFANHDEGIAQALSLDPAGMAQVRPAKATHQQATNFTLIHASANLADPCCPL